MTPMEKLLAKWKVDQKLLLEAAAEGGFPTEETALRIASLKVAIGALEILLAEG